ncbi:type IV-A pilus assembly ATPase PilB [Porticoccaceae bacterium]|nr:type IV-A pilus assembly ATPase PilB [Porticoccaceae bacterium]
MNLQVSTQRGLPKTLIDEGLISADEMTDAINRAKLEKCSLVTYLCQKELVDGDRIAQLAATEFGMALYDLDNHDASTLPKDLVDTKLLRKHLLLPLFIKGKRLYIATPDPFDTQGLREIQFQVRMPVEPVLVTYSQIMALREGLLNDPAGTLVESLNIDEKEYQAAKQSSGFDVSDDTDADGDGESTPIVRFINKMILDAIAAKASDIHFEPYDQYYRVRFRIDGILRQIFTPPSNWSARLVSRIKIMADLDITERRLPQDGRIRVAVSSEKSIDLRVNTLPLQFGEKVVMRILDPSSTTMGIDALGYEDDQRTAYLNALNKPQGMILVTGPTGSGKTVSLYTGLNLLNTDERNISTAEDPVEINIAGINQTQINLRTRLDFPTAMRAFLRQDPDVIMVGEIRDLDTAEIAVKASQTGHLVLSTLHTNSSSETLNRLLNMGLSAFNVATSVSLIIAQRLARKLCVHCRELHQDLPEEVLKQEGFNDPDLAKSSATIYKARGCKKCIKGYSGRVGVYETLIISPAICAVILNGGSAIDILAAAKKEGFRTLRTSALRKVIDGTISIEEANRITTD